jgi:hypothetical protein
LVENTEAEAEAELTVLALAVTVVLVRFVLFGETDAFIPLLVLKMYKKGK